MTFGFPVMSSSPRSWTAATSYRKATEDRARVWELPDDSLVVCVADGAGGIGGGAKAAEMVIEAVDAVVSAGSGEVGWIRVLRELDPQIEGDREAGESTAIILRVDPVGSISGASCGDSTAWFIAHDGHIADLTEQQHRKRRLGSGRALPVAFAREAATGWIVAASDGLFGTTSDEQLVETLTTLKSADPAQALVAAARTPRGTWLDDVVVVVLRVDGPAEPPGRQF